MDAPQEVVSALFLSRCLERFYANADRVAVIEHLPDRAVLAGRVAALQHDQYAMLARVIQQIVEFGELFFQRIGQFLDARAHDTARRLCRNAPELNTARRRGRL